MRQSHDCLILIWSSAIIMRFNISWYCIYHCSDWGSIQRVWTRKRQPYPTLTGELLSVFWEDFGENWLVLTHCNRNPNTWKEGYCFETDPKPTTSIPTHLSLACLWLEEHGLFVLAFGTGVVFCPRQGGVHDYISNDLGQLAGKKNSPLRETVLSHAGLLNGTFWDIFKPMGSFV